jgi:hypothetical protein
MAALHRWVKLSFVSVLASREKKKAMEDYEYEETVAVSIAVNVSD